MKFILHTTEILERFFFSFSTHKSFKIKNLKKLEACTIATAH